MKKYKILFGNNNTIIFMGECGIENPADVLSEAVGKEHEIVGISDAVIFPNNDEGHRIYYHYIEYELNIKE